jgi:hypothetical protein
MRTNVVQTVNLMHPKLDDWDLQESGSIVVDYGSVHLFWFTDDELADTIADLVAVLGRVRELKAQSSMEPLHAVECEGSEMPHPVSRLSPPERYVRALADGLGVDLPASGIVDANNPEDAA